MQQQPPMFDLRSTSGRIVRFFSNPAVGVLGSLASIVGVGLALFFYFASQEERLLSYYVHPAKAAVLRSGLASPLEATFNGQPIETDVTVAQVAIWNDGELAIRSENVLESLVLRTEPSVPILDATVRSASRDVINFRVSSEDDLRSGRVSAGFRILERGDGGVIQLTYAGGTTVDIVASAAVEGQAAIRRLEFSGQIRSPAEQYASFEGERRRQVGVLIGMALVLLALAPVLLVLQRRRARSVPFWFFPLLLVSQAIFSLAFALYLYVTAAPEGPPFGF